jgi:SAM-dependent methyltransferase
VIPSPFPSIDADAYQRLRRDYPREAIEWFVSQTGLVAGARVLDAGAGTGQASRPLLASGLRVIAMEPARNLRTKLHVVLPDASIFGGVAEAIPLRDRSLDAVVAAQTFQWFDGPRAVPELHRVLRPGGALAIVWIDSDESSLHREMWEATGEYPEEGSVIDQAQDHWRTSFAASDLFEPFRTATFPFARRLAAADIPTYIATSSDIAVLSPERRDLALSGVKEWAEKLPAEVEFPMVAEVNLTFARR